MENVRITILDMQGSTLGHLDNDLPDALHYYNDTLHTYLKGSAYTFEFTCNAAHNTAEYLQVGNKLIFNYGNRPYYLNISVTEETETTLKVTAYGNSLELLNEYVGNYSPASAQTFKTYFDYFVGTNQINIGINEVSSLTRTLAFTSTETILARLFSIASSYDAELEFIPNMSGTTLNGITMNVYRAHDTASGIQGMGQDHTDTILRYDKDIQGITRTCDITGMYNAIRPYGNNNLTLSSISGRTVYDDDGQILYKVSGTAILAPQSMQRFPSNNIAGAGDKYICYETNISTDTVEGLYNSALSMLAQYCEPQVEYSITGYIDGAIGDTFTVSDESFHPALNLEVRIIEQQICFTDSTKNKTTFGNVIEEQSQIDPSLIERMKEIAKEEGGSAEQAYSLKIISNNGSVFRDAAIETELTALVYKGNDQLSDDEMLAEGVGVVWTGSDGTTATGTTLTISKSADVYKVVFSATLEEIVG